MHRHRASVGVPTCLVLAPRITLMMYKTLAAISAISLVSILSYGCGSETETPRPSAIEEGVDCVSIETQEECWRVKELGERCTPVFASIYQDDLECYLASRFFSCEAFDGNLNSATPARHIDGRCAIFAGVFLPKSGEWTPDETCGRLDAEICSE